MFKWLWNKGIYYLLAFWFLTWIIPFILHTFSLDVLRVYLKTMYDMPLDIIHSSYPANFSAVTTGLYGWVEADFFFPSGRIAGVIIGILVTIKFLIEPGTPNST